MQVNKTSNTQLECAPKTAGRGDEDASSAVAKSRAEQPGPAETKTAQMPDVVPVKPRDAVPATESEGAIDLVSPQSSPTSSKVQNKKERAENAENGQFPAPKRQCLAPSDGGEKQSSTSVLAGTDAMEVEVVEDEAPVAEDGGAPQPAPTKEAKPKPVPLSVAEKEARTGMLRDELDTLARIKLSGDAIPSLRPSASDMINDFDLDAIRSSEAKAINMKTRQVMARFLEGSARNSKEVAALLLGGAANKPSEDDEAECMLKIEECISVVANLVERRPKITEGRVQSDGIVKRWEVKDVADIPERCRTLVETHRKMEAALCERIKLIETLLTELSSSKPKSMSKLDKNLVIMKDKFRKLEEKESKERNKLEGKLESNRRKQQQREEREKEKAEKDKVRAEEKEAKTREAKPAQELMPESDDPDFKPVEETPSREPKVRESKPPSRPKKSEPSKKAAGGASSADIKSFFGGAVAQKAAAASVGSEDKSMPKRKEKRNFPAWERPKNAVVAAFPFGPGEGGSRNASQPAVSADLTGWLSVMRNETMTGRTVRTRPLREDGTPHPKMKFFKLKMLIPLTETQLIDVEIDAEKKIWWDNEWDEAEDKLREIKADWEPQSDGLYKYQGRILQMQREGGGFYDCPRPAFYGTHSKVSGIVNPRQPLLQDPELDYAYESDGDWESEMGDGEDIGSDLDGDDDEEEDEEDGGFVVPDGYGSDECEGEEAAKTKKRKLEQIVHYRALPAELAELLTVQVLDKLPLCLSSDPNVYLEENVDYFGEDVSLNEVKAPNLEAAIQALHKHPTAVAFTYILPGTEHKLAGRVFLKGKKPSDETKQPVQGFVSGYLQKVPEAKSKAVWNAMMTKPTGLLCLLRRLWACPPPIVACCIMSATCSLHPNSWSGERH